MTDLKKYEEICEKYGNSKEVQDAVMAAFTFKENEFEKYHKPVYEVEDFEEYKRHLIQLRPNVALLLHIFERNTNGNFESAWLDDNEAHYAEDIECIKDSAHQLLLQLEGRWCTAFIEALRDECNDIIKHEKNMDKDKIEQIIKEFNELSDDEKEKLCERMRFLWPFMDYEVYKDPVTKKENMKELQEKMVQLCIDYINEHNLTDIEEIHFSVDELQESSKNGEWTPMTDSFIYSFGYQENDKGGKVRKCIEQYC